MHNVINKSMYTSLTSTFDLGYRNEKSFKIGDTRGRPPTIPHKPGAGVYEMKIQNTTFFRQRRERGFITEILIFYKNELSHSLPHFFSINGYQPI